MILEQDLVTPVPVAMAIQKLRGFVADHQAKIVSTSGNRVRLEIDDRAGQMRRRGDRSLTFLVDLKFGEETFAGRDPDASDVAPGTRTRIHFAISPRKDRDRRRADVADRAREVLTSFRSYLMASKVDNPPGKGVLYRATRIIAPWLTK